MKDFEIIDGELIRYNGQDSVVKIPDSVIRIGKYAFRACFGVTDIIIPNSVTIIGEHAFDECHALTHIEIPNSVTVIDECAFSGCTGLTSIELPDSIIKIKFGTFNGCKNLRNIKFPNLVIEIENNVFIGCSSLTSIEVPNSVIRIGEEAFAGCMALTNIRIPKSVITIGWGAFDCCEALTSIDVAEGNASYASVDGALYDKEKKTLIRCPQAKTSINIPSSVTCIGNSAFWGCIKLIDVVIPNSVTSIDFDTFSGCEALKFNKYDNAFYVGNEENPYAFLICAESADTTTCIIKDTCRCIGERAFKGREALTSIIIPDSVITIGQSAFAGCEKLTSVTIGNSVTSIGMCAFENCKELTSITIPDSVTKIENGAFYRCPKLTNIIIGNNIRSIQGGVFKGCRIKHKPKNNIAYKGFLVDMTCRNFQYKEGETYTCDEAELCACGFHACLNPLDCFNYYYDNYVVYHEVILEDRSDETGDDSKICGKKITIGRQLTIQEMFAIFNELNKD